MATPMADHETLLKRRAMARRTSRSSVWLRTAGTRAPNTITPPPHTAAPRRWISLKTSTASIESGVALKEADDLVDQFICVFRVE